MLDITFESHESTTASKGILVAVQKEETAQQNYFES